MVCVFGTLMIYIIFEITISIKYLDPLNIPSFKQESQNSFITLLKLHALLSFLYFQCSKYGERERLSVGGPY